MPALQNISTKLVLLSVAAMILTHLFLLGYYSQEHKTMQHRERRAEVIQQVMNTIHMVKATPQEQLDRALKANHESNITSSLSDKPEWKLQANDLTYWMINQLVPRTANSIRLSLHLPDKRWLNIDGDIQPRPWVPQLFLLSLEIPVTLVILFYLWSINRFTKPLKDFRHVAERLGIALTPVELSEFEGPSIVRETANAMNTMQQRIRDLIKDRTQMLAAISHDLRTPITRIKLRLSKITNDEIRTKSFNDLDEMDSMIGEILDFARAENSDEKVKNLDLNSLLQVMCDDLKDDGYPTEFSAPDKRMPILAQPLALKRAFMNLIQNAIKFGDRAQVSLSLDHHHIIVTVDDDGPGIPDEELDDVFSPFYRVDQSRSRKIAGTGLGLAVARNIILAHHGQITLINREKGGLRATVTLKLG